MTVLYFFLEYPYRYFVIDYKSSAILEQGFVQGLTSILPIAKKYDEVIGVVPGEHVSILEVEIPIRVRKKALQAIPFVLEDKLAANIDDVHFFLFDWRPNKTSTVAIIQREKWFNYLHWIESSDIEIKTIIPDYSLLPLGSDESAILFLEAETERVLIKFLQKDLLKGMVISLGELSYWLDEFDSQEKKIVCNDVDLLSKLMNSKVQNVEILQSLSKNKIEDICLEFDEKKFSSLQLYNSDIAKKVIEKNKPWLIFSIIFLLFALLINISFDVYEYKVLKSEEIILEKKIEDIFKKNFPNVDRIVDAQLQFQREIEALKGNAKGSQEFLFLVDKVITILPRNVTLIDEIYYRNSTLDVVFKVNNFQILDEFSAKLEESDSLQFERISSDSQGGKVFAKYRFSVLR